MKKLYFLFFLVFGLNAYSQNPDDIVYIPDANLKAFLVSTIPSHQVASTTTSFFTDTDYPNLGTPTTYNFVKIDTNNDGEIQVSEAEVITYLHIILQNQLVYDLTGIESFVNLISFACSSTDIPTLTLPNLDNLKYLRINNNRCTSLNISGYSNLLNFLCFQNGFLTSLDISQNSNLLYINCSENYSLTSLSVVQNPVLNTLDSSNCYLTSMNVSQNPVLSYLSCSQNQLTSLNVDQNPLLSILYCYDNQLLNLDISNLSLLSNVNVDNNPNLNTLNLKNGRTNTFSFSDCPNIEYICVDESELNSIQTQINLYNLNNNCHVNSYCSFVPGGNFYSIQGTTRLDVNNNGCDSNDLIFPNQRFTITNGSITGTIIANAIGSYSIPVQPGGHTLTPQLENPSYFTVSPASVTVNFPSATSPYTQDFCITANGVKNDLEVTVIPVSVARPGFDAEYKIIYKNKGNQVANGSLIFTFEDTVMDLVSVIPVNDNSATNSLSWNYTNLNPFETREISLIFNINSPMETPAVNGDDVLVYTATIVGATDETPNDNTFTLNQTVVNSYDPNDKTCLEGATITPSMVGQYVHYVIRFENTGTYPAENIVVKDMIDTTKFDIATLVPQRASHDFYTRINGNKVEFIFENINLPFDDANNDGYVAFKIKTKPTLVLGNTFTNSASIYFDYNFPIVTDPATTTVAALSNKDFDFGNYFTLYPNPAKDILNFEVKKEIGVKSVSVYNTLGQIVIAITNVDNLKDIDVSSLNIGSYFVKVYTDKGNAVSKFIKQ